jgi:hypothetical protein
MVCTKRSGVFFEFMVSDCDETRLSGRLQIKRCIHGAVRETGEIKTIFACNGYVCREGNEGTEVSAKVEVFDGVSLTPTSYSQSSNRSLVSRSPRSRPRARHQTEEFTSPDGRSPLMKACLANEHGKILGGENLNQISAILSRHH